MGGRGRQGVRGPIQCAEQHKPQGLTSCRSEGEGSVGGLGFQNVLLEREHTLVGPHCSQAWGTWL